MAQMPNWCCCCKPGISLDRKLLTRAFILLVTNAAFILSRYVEPWLSNPDV